MEYRALGKTGLSVSALGFGCGNVGGLMVRGTPAERERAVARAVELGINYFDTAPSYGDGQSEEHLGRVLRALKPSVYVGTKFRLGAADLGDITAAITRSVETSLGRLGLERVDLLQLHNPIASARGDERIAVKDLGEIGPALERLRAQGKTRFVGLTALGETRTLHEALGSGVFDTAQVCVNLVNPSAAHRVPAGFPAQDFAQLLGTAAAQRMGVIAIRALAAGALSGTETRHPVAVPTVAPIASGPDYRADVERARRLRALVDEGHAESLIDAAIRFALGVEHVSTILVGYSSLDHLEAAAASFSRGPLSRAALDRLAELWKTF